MSNLLSFFEGSGSTGGGWTTYVVLGVMLVMLVLLMILPQRKQKKKAEEMMSKLQVGSSITTIGGIVGEVTEIDGATNTLVIRTGDADNATYMKILRNAIYTVNAADKPVVTEGVKANEEDEIK